MTFEPAEFWLVDKWAGTEQGAIAELRVRKNHEKTQSAKYKAGKAQTAAAATPFIIFNSVSPQLFYYSFALSRLAHRHAVTHPAHCLPPTTARTAGWRTGLGVERAAEVPSLLGQIFLGHPTLTYTPATAPSTCVGRVVHPILPAES